MAVPLMRRDLALLNFFQTIFAGNDGNEPAPREVVLQDGRVIDCTVVRAPNAGKVLATPRAGAT